MDVEAGVGVAGCPEHVPVHVVASAKPLVETLHLGLRGTESFQRVVHLVGVMESENSDTIGFGNMQKEVHDVGRGLATARRRQAFTWAAPAHGDGDV